MLASLMGDLRLGPSTEKPLTPSWSYTRLSPTSSEVGRCRGCHAGRAVWPGEAEILSASVKALPALAALSRKKKNNNKNKPAFVGHLLFSLLASSVYVCGKHLPRSYRLLFHPVAGAGTSAPAQQAKLRLFPKLVSGPGCLSSCVSSAKREGMSYLPRPIHLEEFEPKC